MAVVRSTDEVIASWEQMFDDQERRWREVVDKTGWTPHVIAGLGVHRSPLGPQLAATFFEVSEREDLTAEQRARIGALLVRHQRAVIAEAG